MKLKVQAQHLQPGDIVGSGEKILSVTRSAIKLPSNKVWVVLEKGPACRGIQWGKYTMINVERSVEEKVNQSDIIRSGGGSNM